MNRGLTGGGNWEKLRESRDLWRWSKGRGYLLSWGLGILLLSGLVIAIFRVGEIEQFLDLMRQAQPEWLLPAICAQLLTYAAAAAVWRAALRASGHPCRFSTLLPLGVAKLFADQAIPSGGISGTMLVMVGFGRLSVPVRAGMTAMLVGLVSFYGAYLTVVLASLGLLWLHQGANRTAILTAGLLAIVALSIPAVVLGLKHWSDARVLRWVKKSEGLSLLLEAMTQAPTDLLYNPRLLAKATVLQLLVFLLDSFTLWLVLRSIGLIPEPWIAFVSFVLASATATLAPIPLGLGTFEAACTGMLHLLGVPLEAALTAAILLRGLTFWLPMFPAFTWPSEPCGFKSPMVRRQRDNRAVSLAASVHWSRSQVIRTK